MIIIDFGDLIAQRIRVEHRTLAARWFARLLDLLPVEAREVFPTESLLDHVPALIAEIGDYIRRPAEGAIVANTAILAKARELGALRHAQRASLHQVLREYQVLDGVLVAFVLEEMERLSAAPAAAESVHLISRLHQAVEVLSQATVEAFVALYTRTINDQNERLEQFTRMAAHEWRQPLGALQFAVRLLRLQQDDRDRIERTVSAIERTVQHLVDLTHKLESVARMQRDGDSPVLQEIPAATVAHEAARQLREMADARGVTIRVGDDLPTLTVDVGRLELVLVNLMSNAIKYADPSKAERYVVVSGTTNGDDWCQLDVRDNGIGIPPQSLATVFQRFTRAHTAHADVSHVEGLGLGLSIADDCVRAMGGRIEVASAEHEGTVFTVILPTSPAVKPPDADVP
ncbi:MAG TPA: HAMP domain-containing sensor histidine kinase [Vicinamibacterales bacterium]|nr:HAMP domain-containing sensor histidine kinase [Vicinamibacterales bacterium]